MPSSRRRPEACPKASAARATGDYRYTWIRDAVFTLYGLMGVGFTEAAGQFMGFLEARHRDLNADRSLQIMYGLDGRRVLTEESLVSSRQIPGVASRSDRQPGLRAGIR